MNTYSKTPTLTIRGTSTKLFHSACVGLACLAFLASPQSWGLERQIQGVSSGIFANPIGPAGMTTSGAGTASFSWGDPGGFGTGPSRLQFTGGSFSSIVETQFTLGTLDYFNGTVVPETQADLVDLLVTLSLTLPAGTTQEFVFAMQLINTPNTGGAPPENNADTVFLPTVLASNVFQIGGIDYTLKLVFGQTTAAGFSQIDKFFVFEGAVASAQLLATITSRRPPVMPGKLRCLEELIALRETAPEERKLNDAVFHVANSLNPDLWLDEDRLQRNGGQVVFNEEKHAIQALQLLLDHGSLIPDADLRRVISCLLNVDRLLALLAIDEATVAGRNPQKLAEIVNQLDKGDLALSQDKYVEAIDHYRNAWNQALHVTIEHLSRTTAGAVQLRIAGFAGQACEIQASTNLKDWVSLGTQAADAQGIAIFEESNPPGDSIRFYRAVAP